MQLFLASQQFPLPHLIGTRRENNSMLQWRNGVYELFEYIPGQNYPQTLEATFDSGPRVLALYHKLLADFKSEWQPPSGSYHLAPAVEQGLRTIPTTLVAGRGPDSQISPVLTFLQDSYYHAAQMVEDEGIESWPKQIVHADWHPGNMLYRDNHVVAVIDYDSARLLARIIDIANGALQFSIIGGDDDVAKWPDYVDESRFKRFLRGYDEVMLLSQAEVRTIPWLMIEGPDRRGRLPHRGHRILRAHGRAVVPVHGAEKGALAPTLRRQAHRDCRRIKGFWICDLRSAIFPWGRVSNLPSYHDPSARPHPIVRDFRPEARDHFSRRRFLLPIPLLRYSGGGSGWRCHLLAALLLFSLVAPLRADPPTAPASQPGSEIRRWLADLANGDAAVREQARIQLMGMKRQDLIEFRAAVRQSLSPHAVPGGRAPRHRHSGTSSPRSRIQSSPAPGSWA